MASSLLVFWPTLNLEHCLHTLRQYIIFMSRLTSLSNGIEMVLSALTQSTAPKTALEQDFNSVACTTGTFSDRMTYQVLLQFFVVGYDAIVDDNKL